MFVLAFPSRLRPLRMRILTLTTALLWFAPFARAADSPLIDPGPFPARVHVFEDFETEIEKHWWLRGVEETKNFPPSRSALPNTRAWRSGGTNDFDDKQGKKEARYGAVIFNPVPGPPMGKHTRLGFRYYLKGTDKLRVQIFSLTNNYHRMIVLTDLPKEKWTAATVDMTRLRRPDGTGGPLSLDERIDDIQFYVDPKADPGGEVTVDDIVLYDAADEGEKEPFPKRILFTAWFDTGKQGKIGVGRSGEGNEWPGDFAIVAHEPPRTWKAAKSVENAEAKTPWLRIGLRGRRPVPPGVKMRVKARLTGADAVKVVLADSKAGRTREAELKAAKQGEWAQATVDLSAKPAENDAADELRFLLPAGAELTVDDVVLYEP